MTHHHHVLLLILLLAVIAPLINQMPTRVRLPLVVTELLLGMAFGPQGLDLIAAEGVIPSLSALGLCFLFFLAGMELDFARLRGAPLRLGTIGWMLSLALAAGAAYGLHSAGLIADPLLIAVALSTTAIGTLMPILRDAGELDTPLGTLVLGAGAMGEFGPIILFSLLLTGGHGVGEATGLLMTFIFIAIAGASLLMRLRPPPIVALMTRTLHGTSQLPVRSAMLILGTMVVLADAFGLNLLLGGFAAGALVGLVARGPDSEAFRHKLDALGFGFFIPIFFVVSGTQIDVAALAASPEALARVPLFLVLLLLVRGLPAVLYRRALDGRQCVALGLLSATSLPLIVVIAGMGKASGAISSQNAAALVGAAILSVLLFPLLALALRRSPSSGSAAIPAQAPSD